MDPYDDRFRDIGRRGGNTLVIDSNGRIATLKSATLYMDRKGRYVAPPSYGGTRKPGEYPESNSCVIL